ncbi:lysine methyltransferase [Pseudomonas sp. TWP3-2]|uniref:lysine methyltransferase n=1 Tax=Pseudomonas sp. TWP3-2 TaxID=2804574 RepID=UPI003CF11331
MNTAALQGHPPPPSEGIYLSSRLPVRLGFPSAKDFNIVRDGQGIATDVVACRNFLRISRMCRVSGQLVPYPCQRSRQMAPGVHIYDPRFFGLFRHSCYPNVFLDLSELWLWALIDIHPGDSLTMDYAATEGKLRCQFACGCGASCCRGWIYGFDETPNAEGQRFLQDWRKQGFR